MSVSNFSSATELQCRNYIPTKLTCLITIEYSHLSPSVFVRMTTDAIEQGTSSEFTSDPAKMIIVNPFNESLSPPSHPSIPYLGFCLGRIGCSSCRVPLYVLDVMLASAHEAAVSSWASLSSAGGRAGVQSAFLSSLSYKISEEAWLVDAFTDRATV